MVTNQIDFSWLEQRSVIKFLVARKYKLCKIYRRMICMEEYFLVKRFFTLVLHYKPELKR